MRRPVLPTLIVIVTAALVAGFVAALRSGAFPLGVPGEWEWLRLPVGATVLPIEVVLGTVGVLAFAAVAGVAVGSLRTRATIAREIGWVTVLALASVAVQRWVQGSAPAGYGLAKWVVALSQKGSSGYFRVASDEARDLPRFLAGYPQWIQRQDALHIGTHPPGLIAVEATLLHAMEAHPRAARLVEDAAPESVATAWRVFARDAPLSPAARATLVLTGELTLLACALTVVPLYVLARASLPPSGALAVATLWPLMPSAMLFQPTADTALPLLSTSALALAAHASPGRRPWLAGLSGVLLGVGMQFTLAFLAVGLIAGLITLGVPGRTWQSTTRLLFAIGMGFLGLTLAFWAVTGGNPFLTWWWNQANHGRFYQEFHRSYAAWLVANPLELAIGIGLPAAVWAVLGLAWPRAAPRSSMVTFAVLVLLTVSGRNLSEVGRLWLPFMPALLVVAGFALEKLGAGPKSLAVTVALVGLQTVALQTTIQVVYPV
jgi:hypothetical protein